MNRKCIRMHGDDRAFLLPEYHEPLLQSRPEGWTDALDSQGNPVRLNIAFAYVIEAADDWWVEMIEKRIAERRPVAV